MDAQDTADDDAEQEHAQGGHSLVGGAFGGRLSHWLRLGLGMGGTTLTLSLDRLTVSTLTGTLISQLTAATLLLELTIINDAGLLGVGTEDVVVDDAGALRVRRIAGLDDLSTVGIGIHAGGPRLDDPGGLGVGGVRCSPLDRLAHAQSSRLGDRTEDTARHNSHCATKMASKAVQHTVVIHFVRP